jgi:hypothetical protein
MEINFSVTKPATTVEQCQVKSRKYLFMHLKGKGMVSFYMSMPLVKT